MRNLFLRLFLFLIRLLMLLGILFLLFRLGEYAYDFGHQIYSCTGMQEPPGTDLSFTVKEGDTVLEVADKLEYLELIADKHVFIIQERLSKYHGSLQAGDYILNTSWSAGRIIDTLTGHSDLWEESEES